MSKGRRWVDGLPVLGGPAPGVAGGRGADLGRREQRTALRRTKASSAAVSFTLSVKEQGTAHPGHGNGPHPGGLAIDLSLHLRAVTGRGDDTRNLGGGTRSLFLRPRLLALALVADGERGAADEAVGLGGQGPVLGALES